jgi:protease-4
LLAFRESGKPAWGWGAAMEEIDLYLGAACDSLFSPPTGMVQINGIGFGGTYLKGTFDLVGINPNFQRTGSYKSAPETYTHDSMSASARRENEWLLEDIWNEFVDTYIGRRGFDGQEFTKLLQQAMFSSYEARDVGLIDDVRHLEQILSAYTDKKGIPQWVGVLDYRRDREQEALTGGKVIAVVHSRGMILRGPHGYHPNYGAILGSSSVIRDIEDAVFDKDVVAIVLRVDSGGGDIIASDMIRNAVERASARKPVIVSMVDVAASGGYMVAYPASRILAMPGTITGSIGAFTGKFNLAGLYEKIGVSKDFVTRGEFPLLWSDYHDWTVVEESLISRQLWDNYDRWTADIAAHRNLKPAAVDSIARGRVWTGRQAFENGLVDDLGTLEDAIDLSRQLARLDESVETHVVHYPVRRSWIDLLLNDEEVVWGALQQRLRQTRSVPSPRSWSRTDLRVTR